MCSKVVFCSGLSTGRQRFENSLPVVEVCVHNLSDISVIAVRMASSGSAPEKIWVEGKLCACARTRAATVLFVHSPRSCMLRNKRWY